MKKILVIYSGGLDSFTLLNKAILEGNYVEAISFDYGQKHFKELDFAKNVCSDNQINHKIVKLKLDDILSDSALVGEKAIPKGNYDKEQMKQTVVPNRNMIMISIAASLAIKNNLNTLWYAAHAGDHEIYPDCRPEFIESLAAVLEICDYHKINFEAPFMNYTKTDIVAEGLRMKIDFSKTWTCYVGDKRPCLSCGSCLERKSAFELNNVRDPLR